MEPEATQVDGLTVGTPKLDAFQVFSFYRSEIKDEHSLLSGRVSWYVTSQSFMLTVYAISRNVAPGGDTGFKNVAQHYLPAIGVVISLLAFLTIFAAVRTIWLWGRLQSELIRSQPSLKPILMERWNTTPDNTGPHRDWTHFMSLLFPMATPLLFGAIWILIIVNKV